jgi:alpha-glucosidase/alpha-D-xyloside xylohydrolase
VTLETTPLYVRAGAVVPMGPVRQYVDEPSAEPLTLTVYPGADGSSVWYEDDGRWRPGSHVALDWRDASRTLTIRLTPGSRVPDDAPRRLRVVLAGSTASKDVTFDGKPTAVNFDVRTMNVGAAAEQL